MSLPRFTPIAALLATMLLIAAGPATAQKPWTLEAEAAMVQPTRNDVRIPGDSGTEFSLTDDLSPDDDVAFRVRLGRQIGERSHVSLLYAPLVLHSEGTPGFAIDYDGVTFAEGAKLESTYKFNSYRATWRYDLARSDDLSFGLGLTGKVRDAYIELTDGSVTTRKDNVGFVPLIHFRLAWNWGDTLGLLVEGDALAAPQGRAEDVLAALVLRPRSSSSFRLGYRILEGGADNDEVYSFALINYYTFGWVQRF